MELKEVIRLETYVYIYTHKYICILLSRRTGWEKNPLRSEGECDGDVCSKETGERKQVFSNRGKSLSARLCK